MKKHRILTFAVLFTMLFSITHEYAFTWIDEDHCTVQEYVQEIEAPSDHGDICDTHFEYHMAFLLPSGSSETPEAKTAKPFILDKKIYLAHHIFEPFRPPIA